MPNTFKKYLFCGAAFLLAAANLPAQTSLNKALPLLQKKNRTAAQTQQVLTLLRTSTDPNTVFAAGASLVKTPPAKAQEPALFNIILRATDPLKQTFAAVILTAMGNTHTELMPILQEGLQSKDPVLVAYAAAAAAILDPQDKTHATDLVRLYAYDPAFAQRAMNLTADSPKEQLKILKAAVSSSDALDRAAAAAWLGVLHSEEAAQVLLKRAKSENDPQVQSQLATALAKNRSYTLDDCVKGLRKNYTSPAAATYALALGFMTGNAVTPLKEALLGTHKNARINAARAAAYMAGVLSTPDAFTYSSDRTFDISLLKSLIPQLNVLAKTGDETLKIYAENALKQIEKLMI